MRILFSFFFFFFSFFSSVIRPPRSTPRVCLPRRITPHHRSRKEGTALQGNARGKTTSPIADVRNRTSRKTHHTRLALRYVPLRWHIELVFLVAPRLTPRHASSRLVAPRAPQERAAAVAHGARLARLAPAALLPRRAAHLRPRQPRARQAQGRVVTRRRSRARRGRTSADERRGGVASSSSTSADGPTPRKDEAVVVDERPRAPTPRSDEDGREPTSADEGKDEA